ncbi:regulatory protein TetR [Actinobacteria bacterium OK074]|nr:regulatory protein TetR [Actinobacteria bacterium OK074]
MLDGARKLFAERGFERTTIRAVAESAGVDPSLVMQYFGSKRELFARVLEVPAAEAPEDAAAVGDLGGVDALVEHLLVTLGVKLGGLPEGTLAALRSMLTEPSAADHARGTLGRQIASVAGALPADGDAELRAALLTTVVVGVAIGHQLLGLAPLRDAPADRIAELLRPALRALAEA